ncbi:MAG: hypothetical protein WC880_03720 [Candidatus Paceibacterota bacterium]
MKITLVPLLAVFIFTGFLFSSIPNFAHAGPTAGGGCSGVTWEYQYTIVTDPFPPNSAGSAAFRALYGGESYTIQSTYQVATIGDIDEGCIEEPTVPTAGIIAVPSTIDTGGSSSLSWSSTYATSCTGTNFSTGGATSGSLVVSPSESAVYSVTCTDGTQSASSNASVTVNPPPGPTATLNANPGTVTVGAPSTLTWNSTNAVSCTGSGFDTGGNVMGSVSTGPLSVTTNYSVTCSGASSSVTTSATSGTWQLSYNDISDFFCSVGQTRVSSLNLAYSGLAWCPSSPTGKPCNGVGDQNVCKINVANDACQLETAVYQCVGATGAGPTVVTPGLTASASAVVYVTSPSLSASCSPSFPTVAPGSAITWTAVVSGGSGSYSYEWSGTDGLSGTSALIEKIYSTLGIKTASVTVTDTALVTTTSTVTTPGTTTTTTTTTSGGAHVVIQGGMQCSGGTHVASTNDTQDGVGFGGGADSTLASECSEITPAGGCCNVVVREVSGHGGPVNTYYSYRSYSGASIVQKDSTTTTAPSGNRTNFNYFAGIAVGGTPVPTTTTTNPTTDTNTSTTSSGASVTASCSSLVCTGVECILVPPSCSGPSCPTVTTDPCTGPSCPTTPTTPTTPTSSGVSALLTAFPTTVVYGAPSLLSWTSARAVSCTGGNFNTGGRTAGTLSVTPTDTTLYTLTCTDASGNRAFSTATVTVIAPTLSLIATPQLVRSGDPVTITWFVGGSVNACTVSGPGLSSSLTAGSKSVVITSESLYTFSCTAGSLRPSVSATVKILPAFREQ